MDSLEPQEFAHRSFVEYDSSESACSSDDDDEIVYPPSRTEEFATFSDPGHYQYTDDSQRHSPEGTSALRSYGMPPPPAAFADSNSVNGAAHSSVGPISSHDVSTGRNVVSAALTDATCIAQGPTVGDSREKSGFVRGSEEGKAPENDRRAELLPPVPPKSPLRLQFVSTSPRTPHPPLPHPPLPEVSAARSPVTVPSVSRSFQRRVRSHAYASSDPGHGATVVPPHSLQHKPPLVSRPPSTATTKRTRTMPGYRTSHFPSLSSPSGTYLTPNSEVPHGSYLAERYRYGPLDAILESMQHVEQGNYEHSAVYTGIIAGPSDVVFPRFRGVQVPKPSQGFSPSSDFASASTSTITDSGKRRNKLRKRKPITAAVGASIACGVTCECHCSMDEAKRMTEFQYPSPLPYSNIPTRGPLPAPFPRKRRSTPPLGRKTSPSPSPITKRRRASSIKAGLVRVARAVSLRTSVGNKKRTTSQLSAMHQVRDGLSSYVVEPFQLRPPSTAPPTQSVFRTRDDLVQDTNEARPLSWISCSSMKTSGAAESANSCLPTSMETTLANNEEMEGRTGDTMDMDEERLSGISASLPIRHTVGDAGRRHARGLGHGGELGGQFGGEVINGGLTGAESSGGDKRNSVDSQNARFLSNHPAPPSPQRPPLSFVPPPIPFPGACQCSCHSSGNMATAMTATMTPLGFDRRLAGAMQPASPLRNANTTRPHRPPMRPLTILSNPTTSPSSSTCASGESETSWAGQWPCRVDAGTTAIPGSTMSTPPTSPGVSELSCSAHIGPGRVEGPGRAYFEDAGAEEIHHASMRSTSASWQDQPRKLTKRRREPSLPRTSQGSSSVERGRASDGKGVDRARSRSRSFLRPGRASDERRRQEEEERMREFLPPVRPPSPLWARSSGMLLSPYARTSSHSLPHAAPPQDVTPTDALTSLAFTGHTTALSSSALASLTSRLASPPTSSQPGRLPPWSAAFSVITGNIPEGEAFDPYAEVRQEERASQQSTWKQNLVARTKGLSHRSSLSFLRHDRSRAISSASYPQPQTPDATVRQQRSRRTSTRECSPNTLRRWTLAMADVPDEVLVQELEKLRLEGRGADAKKRKRRRQASAAASSAGHSVDGSRVVHGSADHGKSEDEWVKLPGRLDDDETSSDHGLSSDDEEDDDASPTNSTYASSSRAADAAQDDLGWKTARRALLCCRELVRTERNYQARLRQLLTGDTSTPPPPLVRSYVPALLRASEALLARLEDDPSAWGVSAAFVAVEEEIEAALVAWAGVVGSIFTREEGRKLVKRDRSSSNTHLDGAAVTPDRATFAGRTQSHMSLSPNGVQSIYRKRVISFYDDDQGPNPVSPPESAGIGMFTAALGTGLAYNISPASSLPSSVPSTKNKPSRQRAFTGALSAAAASGSGTIRASWRKTRVVWASASSLPVTVEGISSDEVDAQERRHRRLEKAKAKARMKERAREEQERAKKPAVRELAILPVQRVMRYVLQYRDLLQNTPVESPSRGLVERALESASRVAARCDRAQGNSAFLKH